MWTNEFNPDQPRDEDGKWTDGGSPVGDAFATKGGKFPNAKQSAKWALLHKERYDTDPAFKGTVQAALLFAGGGFSDLRAIDNVNRGLAQPPEMQMHVGVDNLKRYTEKDTTIGRLSHPLAGYHNPFEPDNPDESIHHSTVPAREAVSNLRKAVENGEVFDVPLYRGLVFERLPEWDMRQLEQSRAYVKERTLENGYRQDEIDRLQRNQADADRWEAVYKERAAFIGSLSTLKAGDAFDIDSLSSFTVKEGVADSFARGTNSGQGVGRGREQAPALSVLIEVAPGATGLNVSRLSTWAQSEVIVTGKFKVLAVTDENETSYGQRGYRQESRVVRIKVEPASRLKTNTARWKKDWGRLLMGLDDNSRPVNTEQTKLNNAAPALGYSLRTTEARGWKTNEQDAEGNEGRWVTMSGTPVFIKDGEDPKEAAARTFKDKPLSKSQPIQAPKKEGFFKRALREAKEDIGNYLNPKTPAKPTPGEAPSPTRAGASTKLQQIRDVGLGERETVAELFFKKHVDDLYNGKMSTGDKVDELMKKGVIKTGTEKPETVRERAIKDFDKAVALREQQTADRLTSGEGKRAYTDKTLRAGLGKGETLAERYFAGHVDDLYDGNTSVTAKVDTLIESGELGFGRGDKGFVKMRETAIKDFTRALNMRESRDVKLEKQKLEDAKPRKLTKREQQAEWTPSEEEIAATGPVVGTGWKRNMAENQPRDEQGRWTGVGWHGTRREFDVFDTKAAPASRTGAAADQPPFIYFTASHEKAVPYAVSKRSGAGRPRVIQADLRMDNPLDITKAVKRGRRKGLPFGEAKRIALSELTNAHDGFIYAGDTYNPPEYAVRDVSQIQIITRPKQNTFDPTQPRDEAGKWSLSGSKLVGALTSLYSAQPTPPVDGKGWLRPDGLFVDGGRVSHVAMLRAAYGDRKGKAPAFAEDLYRLAFHAGLVRYDRHAGVIEISGAPTDDQKTALRKMFDGLGTFDEIEVEVFRTPETRYYSEQDRESHRRWMETSPDSMVEKVDAFYGSKGDGYVSPLAAFRGNAFDPNQPRDEQGRWVGGGKLATGDSFETKRLKIHALLATPERYIFEARTNEAYVNSNWLTRALGKQHAVDITIDRNGDTVHLNQIKAWISGKAFGREAFNAVIPWLRCDGVKKATAYTADVPGGLMLQRLGATVTRRTETGKYWELDLNKMKQNAFDPDQPRDEDGKWTGGALNFDNEPSRVGGFTKDVAVRRSTVMKGEERVITWHNPDGSQITDPKLVARAEQLNGTKATAPNYKGAWLNPDTESPLLAIAFDSKDRKHYVYSKEFEQGNAEAKFKIVEQMEKDLPVMRKQAAADRKAGTPEAFLFKLEDLTCIRVGSDKDTGAEKKAYGLTTLRGEHVKVEGDLIKLEFPAKGGESGSYTVKDRELAAFITERKAANGDGPLWPDVTAGKFNAYLKELDPTTDTPVTAHKFRHYHATRIAAEVVARYEGEELNPKAFTRVQKEACEKAAALLSNTWTVTREKYVNPTVWGRLTVKAG